MICTKFRKKFREIILQFHEFRRKITFVKEIFAKLENCLEIINKFGEIFLSYFEKFWRMSYLVKT
jgi:hypothetical protein